MWISTTLSFITRLLVGASPHWVGCAPTQAQRIYFANHSSHLDTLALWSALPPRLRSKTRAVAAADYWGGTKLRRRIALDGLNAVLIDRKRSSPTDNPLTPLFEALQQGDSLIIFPEGTRRDQALPGEFKSGLYHLAKHSPQVELVPVYLDNLHRSMPKGSFFPLPFLCKVRFGSTLSLHEGEDKNDFLKRAREAILQLA